MLFFFYKITKISKKKLRQSAVNRPIGGFFVLLHMRFMFNKVIKNIWKNVHKKIFFKNVDICSVICYHALEIDSK